MGGKSSPKQTDPSALVGQQAALNRLNQYTPFGNIEYYGNRDIQVPGGPDIKGAAEGVRVNLSPEQQQLLQQQQQAQSVLGQRGIQLAGQFPMVPQAEFASTISGPQAAFAPGDFEAARLAAERAVFDRGMSLLRPEFEREDASLQQRLANQGLPQASRAYTSEMERAQRGRGEQMDRLAQAAVLQGLGAQQQGYGQALGTYQTEQQRRQQQYGQDLQAFQAGQQNRAAKLQEILGLFGLQPVQLPQAQNMPQIDVPYLTSQGGGGPNIGMGMSGALGGAATGAMLGSVIPGLGTGLGAGLGGLFGLGGGLYG